MHKEITPRYSTLCFNDYILCEICYEQVHKASTVRYFTLSLGYYILRKFLL